MRTLSPTMSKTRSILGAAALAGVLFAAGCSSSSDPKASMNQGLSSLQKQDYKAAAADFQSVVDNNKDNKGQLSTYAWYNLGVIAQTQNNLPEAIADYQKAVALTPTYLPALFNLATAQTAAGKYQDAAGTYNAILVIRPKDANSMFNLGLLYYQNLNNQVKGRELLNQAIAIAPSLKARVPSTVTLN